MITTDLWRMRTPVFLGSLGVLLILAGCGNTPLAADKSETAGTLNSTVETPDWGAFELVANGQNPETGKHEFTIHSSRSVEKNQLRFVWDFGSGPAGEGLQQSHAFMQNGTYVIIVTAYGVDDSIAFSLKLTIKVDVSDNRPPTAVANTDEVAGENQLVFLFGGGSFDPNEDHLEYKWVQLSGRGVQILHANEASASFVTPLVDGPEDLSFRLHVSDGEYTDFSDVTVSVAKVISPSGSGEGGGGTPVTDEPLVDLNDDGEYDTEDQRVVCIPSSPDWRNLSFAPQSGSFEIGFTAIAKNAFMDAIIGLSPESTNRFSGAAVLVRFNPAGFIDVRDGGTYRAELPISYIVDNYYHFRVIVNVPAKTYSVFITPNGESEKRLAGDFAFRTEQNTANSLAFWNLWSDVDTILQLCNLRLTPAVVSVSASAGNDVLISPGGSTILQGTASGGQSPYTFSWSPTTGLSNPFIPNPIARPTETTTYTLTVRDVWGASSSDSVIVSVRTVALVARAGQDKEMTAGGAVQLDGSASGGVPPYTYQWSPATGLTSTTIATPTARPTATTTYTLTVTDSAGATATDDVVVTVTGGGGGDGGGQTTGAFIVATGAANASDSNPGTEAAPWKTLRKAAATARAGQTVLVKAGVYYETLNPGASGTLGNPIIFKAYPDDECKGAFAGTKSDCRVIIDGQYSRSNGINAYPRKFIRFEGFEIRNHNSDGVYLQGYYDTTAEGLEVVNCRIHTNRNDAVSFRGRSRNCRVDNCELFNNMQTAISFGGGSGHVLRGNNIHYNGKDGMRGGGDKHLIEWNNLYDQFHTNLHPDGMDLGDMSNSVLRYNTISDFTQLMYFHDYDNGGGFSNLQIYGNVFYTDRYWTVRRGEAPGIFFDARFNNSPIKNVTIHSNTFVWTGYNGVIMYGGPLDGVTITNNIFHDSGIDLDGRTSGVKSNYNIFFNSRKPPNEGPGSITADPQFVNYVRHSSWNLRLKSTSPAIDAGDPNLLSITGLSAGFVDKDGTQRPNGTRCDMGAYEFK